MQVSVSTLAKADPATAFAVALDIARWPERIPDISRVEMLTPGNVRVGTRFRETRMMFGREATETMEVAEIEPPRLLVLTAENHGAVYRAEHRFSPEPGGTRIELTFGGRPVTPMAKILSVLGYAMKGVIRKKLEADVAALARAAEAETARG